MKPMSSASRKDENVDDREESAFFGADQDKLFGTIHLPLGSPLGAVLICPSIHSELLANYRKEVLLARALASSGIAVQRFHYRGTGNSDGETEDITFQSMVEDVAEATSRLTSRVEAPFGIMATRWGGIVAAPVVAGTDAPLALWEPILEPDRFFTEVFRARLLRDVGQGDNRPRSGGDALAKMKEEGLVDILGYPICRTLYDSAVGHGLEEGLGSEPRPILIVQMTRTKEVKPHFAGLKERLESKGSSVDIEIVAGQPAWWFVGERMRSSQDVDVTRDWLLERLNKHGV